MGFKEKKQGDTIYMFDSDAAEFKEGIIQSVSTPRMDVNVPSGLVVDVSISFGGGKSTYVFLGDAEVAQMGGTTFSSSMSSILEAVKAARTKHQDIVDNYEAAKDKVTKCETIIKQLDPEMKRAVADEERWKKMESMQLGFFEKMSACMDKLLTIVETKAAQPNQLQATAPATKKGQQTLL